MYKAIMGKLKKAGATPRISNTERQALEAGTTWIEGHIFSGKPSFESILNQPYASLSQTERKFIQEKVPQLCGMVDPYLLSCTKIVPEKAVRFMEAEGFYSFLISKEYGGLDFSAQAISTILAMLAAHSPLLSTFVVIPNSLGAAELIMHYGRQDQKDHYLPRLATGEYLPCFGLTEPLAGSDAASIQAKGILFKNKQGHLSIKLNFSKRYITLAPIANLISLAFRLYDPDCLLGREEDLGITVALIHRGTPGLEMGHHHHPIGDAFYNGPIVGQNVEIDAEEIIGGLEYAGQGWRMLMEQLAGGRAISLPAGAVGSMRMLAVCCGAYARVRHQFDIPIAKMEGVQEKLAEIASMAYMVEGARIFALSAIDNGEQPPVVSAIWKAYLTDLSRRQATNAMDVLAGAGVMQGPNNLVGAAYCSAPVSITVEGANIMTRSLIVFGQGAIRCHPYAMKIADALEADDEQAFKTELNAWVKDLLLNTLRLIGLNLTRGHLVKLPSVKGLNQHLRRLNWASSRFAFLTNMALILVGGKLKSRQQLTGYFSDALAWQLLAISAIRRYVAEGEIKEDLPLVQYACETALEKIQLAYESIYANFSGKLGWLFRTLGYVFVRLNPLAGVRKDRLVEACSRTITQSGPQFSRIAGDLHLPIQSTETNEKTFYPIGLKRLLDAFHALEKVEPLEALIIKAIKEQKLKKASIFELAAQAKDQGIISEEDKNRLDEAGRLMVEAIQVDAFTPEEFFRDEKLKSAPYFKSIQTKGKQ